MQLAYDLSPDVLDRVRTLLLREFEASEAFYKNKPNSTGTAQTLQELSRAKKTLLEYLDVPGMTLERMLVYIVGLDYECPFLLNILRAEAVSQIIEIVTGVSFQKLYRI